MEDTEQDLVQSARREALAGARGRCLIRTRYGFEQRPLIELYDRTSGLLASVGFGPRVCAAAYLHADHLATEQVFRRKLVDADIESLVFWTKNENGHLPLEIRDSIHFSKLRGAPAAALAIVCARRTAALESIALLTYREVVSGILLRCGFEPLGADLSTARASLSRLWAILDRRVPGALFGAFERQVEVFERLVRWSAPETVEDGSTFTITADDALELPSPFLKG